MADFIKVIFCDPRDRNGLFHQSSGVWRVTGSASHMLRLSDAGRGLVFHGVTIVVQDVDLGAAEFADRHAIHEKPVDLLESAPLALGHAEEGKYGSQHRRRAEDEADLGAEVGVGRVEEIGGSVRRHKSDKRARRLGTLLGRGKRSPIA